MAESPVIQVIVQRGDSDCAIVVLAMYLGLSYEDVLAAAAQLDQNIHHTGMWVNQIEKTAKALGVPLRRRRLWDLDESAGILSLTSDWQGHSDHVVVLKDGYIFDTNGCVWTPDVFLASQHYKPTILLERKE